MKQHMKTNKKTVMLSKDTISRFNKLLDKGKVNLEEEGFDADSTAYSVTVDFGNGIEADINVATGENSLFLNPVLFDNGSEATTTDDKNVLNDTFEFEYNGQLFVVCIKTKK